MSFDALFQEASAHSGRRYLDAEEKLRGGGQPALATLRNNLQNSDEVDRLMANCLFAWMEGRAPANQEALDYLQGLPIRLARTPVRIPSATGVARYLNEHYGAAVAEILALRLVKESDWPAWKVIGVLLYLDNVKQVSTMGAVIRFVVETSDPEWRAVGMTVLRGSGDPRLKAKVQAEKDRAQRMKKSFPDLLNELLAES